MSEIKFKIQNITEIAADELSFDFGLDVSDGWDGDWDGTLAGSDICFNSLPLTYNPTLIDQIDLTLFEPVLGVSATTRIVDGGVKVNTSFDHGAVGASHSQILNTGTYPGSSWPPFPYLSLIRTGAVADQHTGKIYLPNAFRTDWMGGAGAQGVTWSDGVPRPTFSNYDGGFGFFEVADGFAKMATYRIKLKAGETMPGNISELTALMTHALSADADGDSNASTVAVTGAPWTQANIKVGGNTVGASNITISGLDISSNQGGLTLTDGLVAEYSLDTDGSDSVGSNDLVAFGGALPGTSHDGRDAAQLPGAGGAGLHPTTPIPLGSSYTISAMFKDLKNRQNSDADFLMLDGSSASGTGNGIWAGGGIYTIAIFSNDELGIFRSASAGGSGFVSSGFSMTQANFSGDNSWHHIAAVNDNGTVTFYVDGVQAGNPVAHTQSDIQAFGSWAQTYNHGFADYVDQVLIYDRALSENEVIELHNNNGETQGENIMSTNLYVELGGMAVDAYPSEPKVEIYSSAGVLLETIKGRSQNSMGWNDFEQNDVARFVFNSAIIHETMDDAGMKIIFKDEWGDGSYQNHMVDEVPATITDIILGYVYDDNGTPAFYSVETLNLTQAMIDCLKTEGGDELAENLNSTLELTFTLSQGFTPVVDSSSAVVVPTPGANAGGGGGPGPGPGPSAGPVLAPVLRTQLDDGTMELLADVGTIAPESIGTMSTEFLRSSGYSIVPKDDTVLGQAGYEPRRLVSLMNFKDARAQKSTDFSNRATTHEARRDLIVLTALDQMSQFNTEYVELQGLLASSDASLYWKPAHFQDGSANSVALQLATKAFAQAWPKGAACFIASADGSDEEGDIFILVEDLTVTDLAEYQSRNAANQASAWAQIPDMMEKFANLEAIQSAADTALTTHTSQREIEYEVGSIDASNARVRAEEKHAQLEDVLDRLVAEGDFKPVLMVEDISERFIVHSVEVSDLDIATGGYDLDDGETAIQNISKIEVYVEGVRVPFSAVSLAGTVISGLADYQVEMSEASVVLRVSYDLSGYHIMEGV